MPLGKKIANHFKRNWSAHLPLEFREPGLHDAAEIRAAIERYAKENGKNLEYLQHGMPIRFTLDGVAYFVRRSWGRGGPSVSALRCFDD